MLNPNQEKIARFFTEAQSLGKTVSPNIVQIYNVGEEPGVYFIEMEYVGGGDLEGIIKDKKSLKMDEALPIMKEICSGLAAAHDKSIIHRDLKPANILRSGDGHFKIADFGLAKNLETTVQLTQDGALMGTPHFMSPEQCRGTNVDKRSDVYSLGALFYYMLAGRRPFESDNPMLIVLMHMNEEVPPPTTYVPDIPVSYSNMIERMMAKNPAERFQDAGEVLRAIGDIEGGAEVAYTAKRIRRRRFRIAAGLVILVLSSTAALIGTLAYLDWLEEKKAQARTEAMETPRDKALRLLGEAKSLFDSGDYKGSTARLHEALGTWSQAPGADRLLKLSESLDRIETALSAGEWERCRDLAAAHRKGFPDDRAFARFESSALLAVEAKDFIASGRFAEARDTAARVQAALPGNKAAMKLERTASVLVSAESDMRESRKIPALMNAEAALSADSGCAAARAIRDRLLSELEWELRRRTEGRELESARSLAMEILKASPDALAVLEVLKGIETSLARFEEFMTEGMKLLSVEDFEKAMELFGQALDLNTSREAVMKTGQARLGLALKNAAAALEAGDFEKAKACYDEAAKHSDSPEGILKKKSEASRMQSEALLRQAEDLVKSGRLEEADKILARADALQPDGERDPAALGIEAEIGRRKSIPPGFVYVPEDAYPVGMPEGDPPKPGPARVGPVYVAISETTNAQFKEFVDAGGYDNRQLWDEEGWAMKSQFLDRDDRPGPGGWAGGTYPSGTADLPVSEISIHEAMAYAAFRKARIPTREEWMVAAGWSPSDRKLRAFPWGDEWKPELGNLMTGQAESSAKKPGTFPMDMSPLGCMDAAGNVAEWTSTPHPDAGGTYFVKGGSFRHNSQTSSAITNDKAKAHRAMRWEMLGFRIAIPAAAAPRKSDSGGREGGGSEEDRGTGEGGGE